VRVPDRVEFEIAYVYPPDQDGRVIELFVKDNGGGVSIPADVFHEHGEVMITIFGREGGRDWTWPVADFVAAINDAVAALKGPPPERA
jgi:hypothetical protein